MLHRGRIRFAISFIACSLALSLASSAFAQQDQQEQEVRRQAQISSPTQIQIWNAIIAESVSTYPGLCPCPYSPNRAGHACGDRSVYSRVGRSSGSLKCYPQDIADHEIARYRERAQ
jgi:hypothetical protein